MAIIVACGLLGAWVQVHDTNKTVAVQRLGQALTACQSTQPRFLTPVNLAKCRLIDNEAVSQVKIQ